MKHTTKDLVCEMYGDVPYEYYPLGQYMVAAPGVCGGRPTFKYTRIDVHHALGLLAAGRTVEQVAHSYDLPIEAVQEALKLTARALTLTTETLEELTAAYMDLPWLDEIRLSQGQVYAVTIIPSDDVSMDEKLLTFV